MPDGEAIGVKRRRGQKWTDGMETSDGPPSHPSVNGNRCPASSLNESVRQSAGEMRENVGRFISI